MHAKKSEHLHEQTNKVSSHWTANFFCLANPNQLNLVQKQKPTFASSDGCSKILFCEARFCLFVLVWSLCVLFLKLAIKKFDFESLDWHWNLSEIDQILYGRFQTPINSSKILAKYTLFLLIWNKTTGHSPSNHTSFIICRLSKDRIGPISKKNIFLITLYNTHWGKSQIYKRRFKRNLHIIFC